MPEAPTGGLTLRPALPSDLPAMAALLEAVIAEGDKTAFERPMTAERVDALFISGPECRGCMVACSGGRLLGFQALGIEYLHGTGWADISSFVAAGVRGGGVGRALWQATRTEAVARKLLGLRAVIRKVNAGAQGYYQRCGFAQPDASLPDGVALELPERTVLVRALR